MPVFILEGNIGSGKSTLLNKLKNYTNDYIIIQEPVDDWMELKNNNNESLFQCFYKDPSKYAYLFQTHIINTRFKKIINYLNNNNKLIICERSIMTDIHIFVEALKELNNINEFEYKIINDLYSTLLKLSNFKPDGIIYLQVDPDTCFKRITKRNRNGEETIDIKYLNILHQKHEQWLLNSNNTLIINNNDDLNKINDFIKNIIWKNLTTCNNENS